VSFVRSSVVGASQIAEVTVVIPTLIVATLIVISSIVGAKCFPYAFAMRAIVKAGGGSCRRDRERAVFTIIGEAPRQLRSACL
jgi:hypothetical protein